MKSLDKKPEVPQSQPAIDSNLQDFAQKLGFNLTPEMMQMGDKDQIQEAIMQSAIDQGKTPDEIAALMAWIWSIIITFIIINLTNI